MESKVIRLLSIIHNGIIIDLVCGFGGFGSVMFLRVMCPGFFSRWGEKTSFFYLRRKGVRSDDSV